MAFITASDFPQLYAVVFGEGVLNDVPVFDKQKLGWYVVFFLVGAIRGLAHEPKDGLFTINFPNDEQMR